MIDSSASPAQILGVFVLVLGGIRLAVEGLVRLERWVRGVERRHREPGRESNGSWRSGPASEWDMTVVKRMVTDKQDVRAYDAHGWMRPNGTVEMDHPRPTTRDHREDAP